MDTNRHEFEHLNGRHKFAWVDTNSFRENPFNPFLHCSYYNDETLLAGGKNLECGDLSPLLLLWRLVAKAGPRPAARESWTPSRIRRRQVACRKRGQVRALQSSCGFGALALFVFIGQPAVFKMKRVLGCALVLGFVGICAALGAGEFWPSNEWSQSTPAEVGLEQGKLETARDYALSAGGSGYIVRHGRLALTWGDARQLYDLKSSTKSFGSIALGLAVKEGKVRLNDPAKKFHPTFGTPPEENLKSGWLDEVTLLHLATQTAGFEKPGGFTRQLFRPGTMWDYSDSGPNWLAECLTLAWRHDLDEVMFERVFTPLGIRRSDLVWRKNQYRPAQIDGIARREFGAGISANVDAMARVGLLMLRQGRWRGEQLIPSDYVGLARRPIAAFAQLPVHTNFVKESGPDAPKHYGLLWWNNADGTLGGVPCDAFWWWGLFDSLIFMASSPGLVDARAC